MVVCSYMYINPVMQVVYRDIRCRYIHPVAFYNTTICIYIYNYVGYMFYHISSILQLHAIEETCPLLLLVYNNI